MPVPRDEKVFAAGLALCYAAVAGFVLSYHEMWRDELQAWLIARDSRNLRELFANLEYDGHPALWHTMLFVLTRATRSPAAMQALHLAIATLTVYIVGRTAPFTRIQRGLFAFGYFTLYEYAAISRNYGPGVLLLSIACAMFPHRASGFFLLSLAIALLAQTSVFGLIAALAFLAAVIVDRVRTWSATATRTMKTARLEEVAGLLLVLVSFTASVIQLIPPADTGYAQPWYFYLDPARVRRTASTLSAVLFPLHHSGVDWWIQPLLVHSRDLRVSSLLVSYVLVLWLAYRMRTSISTLVFQSLATVGLLAFYYVKFIGSIRHQGFLLFVTIAAIWLWLESRRAVRDDTGDRMVSAALTGILAIQVMGGLQALVLEHRYEFSSAKRAALFLRDSGLAQRRIVAEADYAASGVLGYLGARAYFPRGNRLGSFVMWDVARLSPPTDDAILKAAERLGMATGQEVVLLLNRDLWVTKRCELSAKLVRRFDGSTVSDEQFRVYVAIHDGRARQQCPEGLP